MQPDECFPRSDPANGQNRRRPASAGFLLAWSGPASLGLLVVATSAAVGLYLSPWLVLPYWILMASLLGLPSWGKPANAWQLESRQESDPLDVSARSASGNFEPSVQPEGFAVSVVEPDREQEQRQGPELASINEPSQVKTKKAKGRSRKAKITTNVVEPATAATWVQVGPGKFVRSDMLHPQGSDSPNLPSPEPADRIAPESPENVELEDLERGEAGSPQSEPEIREPDFKDATTFDLPFSRKPSSTDQESQVFDPLPEAVDNTSIEPKESVCSTNLPAAIEPSDVRDNGNAPDARTENLSRLVVVEIDSSSIDAFGAKVVGVVDPCVSLEPRSVGDEQAGSSETRSLVDECHELAGDLPREPAENLEDLEAREFDDSHWEDWEIAPSLGSTPVSLPKSGPALLDRDAEAFFDRRLFRPYRWSPPRSQDRRRVQIEAGRPFERTVRNGSGVSRASRRSGRWLGLVSESGRSHPPRSPPQGGWPRSTAFDQRGRL